MEKNSKIFIAGRGGQVGSAIERKFRAEGFENIIGLSSKELDLREQNLTREYFEKERPEYVILAAAKVGGIMANIQAPAEFLYDNLAIQNNIIECSRIYGVKKLLFLASSCIYPRLSPQPMKEDYLMDGKLEPTNEGYAVAKIAGLKMCQYYNQQYGTDFISVMPCNIYGYGDNFSPEKSHVAAALIRKVYDAKINHSKKIPMWGTGSARRELMFVDDLADACFFLFNNYSGNEFFNVGTGIDVSIKELVEIIMDIENYHAELDFDVSKPDGMPQKLMDVSRLSQTGWKAKINLHEGLEKTYKYFLDVILPQEKSEKKSQINCNKKEGNLMTYSLSNDTWDSAEINAAHNVINSRYFTMGSNVKQYEKDFAAKFGAKYAVMSNSGSSANLLMMSALLYSGRMKTGDEVLVTAVSWSTTYFPISQMGFKLRFVDINPETLNIDVNALEAAITPDTKAVMLVNLLGNPNEFDRIQKICGEHNLIMLEDNCESMGATFGGKYAGTFGLIGSFSTYFSHHLCTMEGGMNLTNDEELYHYMLSIRSHGWTRHLPENSPIYKKSDDPFYESFNFIMPGFNLRPLEIEAAVGIEQLKKLDDFIGQRRENAKFFRERLLTETPFRTQKETGKSSWFGFAVILPEEMKGKRDLITKSLRSADIEVRPIVAGNFARQKALKFLDHTIHGTLTNADYIHDNGFFVGNHSIEMKNNIGLLIDILKGGGYSAL